MFSGGGARVSDFITKNPNLILGGAKGLCYEFKLFFGGGRNEGIQI